MLLRFLLVLSLLAAAEIAVLVWLVSEAGFLATIAILIVAGVIGAALAKWQGFRAWRAIRTDLGAGRPPAGAVLDGVMILFAALLLLLPGLLTDLLAILLLVPQIRTALRVPLIAFLSRRVSVRIRDFSSRATGQGEVIDAEFRRADAPRIDDRSR